jgi:anti-sigma regulatory factor (Ser/Thr protein kinase)
MHIVDMGPGLGNPAGRFGASRPLHRLPAIGQSRSSPEPQTTLVRLPCDRHGVRRGLAAAWLFAGRAAIGDDATERLAILVEEWLINVVEHGAAAPDSRIALRLERAGDLVRLTVTDAGQPFDPRESVFEGPNLERGGGAGLALSLAWSRIAESRRRAGRNRLVLEMPLA